LSIYLSVSLSLYLYLLTLSFPRFLAEHIPEFIGRDVAAQGMLEIDNPLLAQKHVRRFCLRVRSMTWRDHRGKLYGIKLIKMFKKI